MAELISKTEDTLEIPIAINSLQKDVKSILESQKDIKSDFRDFKREYVTKLELRNSIDNLQASYEKDISTLRVQISPITADFKDRKKDRNRMLWIIIGTLVTSLISAFKDFLFK